MHGRKIQEMSRVGLLAQQVEIEKLKRQFHNEFSMKEFGKARHIFNMRIERDRIQKILKPSQSDYI